MLQIAGAVLIVGGCSGIGFWYRRRFHTSLWHLRYMQQILERFISEIRYGKATLPECCRQVGERANEPYKTALFDIYAAMDRRDGAIFGEEWQKYMGQALSEIPISGEEREIFLSFSSGGGLSDNLMQIRAIEQYRDMLATAIKMREKDLDKQGRMAAGLGIMSGLLLAVILI